MPAALAGGHQHSRLPVSKRMANKHPPPPEAPRLSPSQMRAAISRFRRRIINLKWRARQNVTREMFWFAGRLGRDRVCALRKGDVEMPSDFAGVGYIEMDDRGAWKAVVLKELETAGYEVDWKKAL